MGGLPDVVCKNTSRICIPLIHSTLSPSCCFLSYPLPQSCNSWLSILDRRRKKLWWHSAHWRCYALSTSHLLLWEKSQAKKVSLGTEPCCLGEEVMWAKWNCSLTISNKSKLRYFFFIHGMLQLCWAPRLHQGTTVHGWLSKLVFSGRGKQENTLIPPWWWCHPSAVKGTLTYWHSAQIWSIIISWWLFYG